MQISVNGQDRSFDKERVNVADVIKAQNVRMPDMLALHINGRQVTSDQFHKTFLREGDEVDYMYRMEHCFYCLD